MMIDRESIRRSKGGSDVGRCEAHRSGARARDEHRRTRFRRSTGPDGPPRRDPVHRIRRRDARVVRKHVDTRRSDGDRGHRRRVGGGRADHAEAPLGLVASEPIPLARAGRTRDGLAPQLDRSGPSLRLRGLLRGGARLDRALASAAYPSPLRPADVGRVRRSVVGGGPSQRCLRVGAHRRAGQHPGRRSHRVADGAARPVGVRAPTAGAGASPGAGCPRAPAPIRGGAPVPRLSRPPDGPAESPVPAHASGPHPLPGAAHRRGGGRVRRRPRQVQARERHPRPCGGRRIPSRGGHPSTGTPARRRPHGEGRRRRVRRGSSVVADALPSGRRRVRRPDPRRDP
jgi:hypothetical protein